MKDFDFFKMLINTYRTQLQRDQQFFEYVERIAKYHFNGATVKQANPMQQMMQNMMGGGGGPDPMKMIGGK